MRRAAILVLPLLLSGCGVSATAVVASAVIDGASVATTGKTVPDYAISAITDRDCMILHGITRGRLCEDPPEAQEEETGAGQPAAPNEDTAAAAFAMAAAIDAEAAAAAPDLGPARSEYRPSWTLLLATVEDYGEAVGAAWRLKPKPGLITATVIDGKVVYRVTTEPFRFEEANARKNQVAAQDFASAVLSAVCPYWMQDESCIVLDRKLPL